MNKEPIFLDIIERFIVSLGKAKEVGPDLASEIRKLIIEEKKVPDKESLERVLKTLKSKDETT